ncbi:hypothetical protein EJ05DRAFT_542279 [Pseudovirgaria hyperparasitica]|uniref:Uncharacterized protein n=1 Tax=Pseudovirgaria hyperparasitica TaxID=470096 RepID=A0A6A6VS32_9PEZI|nr:uncharacterized protein EJ05DRAFT_542279 [Pseudovirgaria hyperparasitica]KAF2752965.1 hypothetical protein EJ05DRAFT_542279 [Pseudovirgaria hyperparasitica]
MAEIPKSPVTSPNGAAGDDDDDDTRDKSQTQRSVQWADRAAAEATAFAKHQMASRPDQVTTSQSTHMNQDARIAALEVAVGKMAKQLEIQADELDMVLRRLDKVAGNPKIEPKRDKLEVVRNTEKPGNQCGSGEKQKTPKAGKPDLHQTVEEPRKRQRLIDQLGDDDQEPQKQPQPAVRKRMTPPNDMLSTVSAKRRTLPAPANMNTSKPKLLSIPKGLTSMANLKWTPSSFSCPDGAGWIYCEYPSNFIRVEDLEKKMVSDYIMEMGKHVGEPQAHSSSVGELEVCRVDWRVVKEELRDMRVEVAKRARLVSQTPELTAPKVDKQTMVEIIGVRRERQVARALGRQML